MRLSFFFLSTAFLLFSAPLFAQCPPPGFPTAGDNCGSPIVCENLDGYCNTINDNNQTRSFPCCTGFTLNNDEWFGFFAGTTTITMNIAPSNCLPGSNGNLGLQAAIYATCPPANPSLAWCTDNLMAAQCACTEDLFSLHSSDFVVGQVYWFVFDGCSGSVCDYNVDVTAGSTVPIPPDAPGAVTGPTPICQGTTGAYSLPAVNGGSNYTWTIVPADAGTVSGTGNSIHVGWAAGFSGNAELCVQVSNACFQGGTSCFTVNVLPKPTATLSGSGVLCTSSGNSVNLTVTLTGDPDWTFVYAINGVNQTPITTSSSPFTIVTNQPGTYTLQSVIGLDSVLDCAGTVSGFVVINQVTFNPSSTKVGAICGQSNGSIDLTVGGNGTPPYLYIWSGGQTTQDLSSMPPGTYTVTVTDANGCSATHSNTIDDVISAPTLTAVLVADTSCASSNGSIDLSVDPASNNTYNWSNGATTQDLSNLAAGTFIVTVTQGLTCTATGSYAVADNSNGPTLSATVVVSSCDFSSGSINATVSGGMGPFIFLWSNGANTEDLINLPIGNYVLTVTAADGCTNTVSATISTSNALAASIQPVSNVNCFGGNNGAATTMGSGGNGAYTYQWSNGTTTATASNLIVGTYFVTITDASNCTASASATITQPAPLLSNASATGETAFEAKDGTATANPSGGTPAYNYSWSNGSTTQTISGLEPGSYTVTVTDATGCSNVQTVTVSDYGCSLQATIAATNLSCNGSNDGTASVSLSGASDPTTFVWSNGATSQTVSGLAAGTYTLTVGDANGCIVVLSTTIQEPPTLLANASTTNLTDYGANDGTAKANPTGGTPGYTYLWSTGETTNKITGLSPGAYTVTVTDANGCTKKQTVFVSNYNCALSAIVSLTHVRCNGGMDGKVTLEIIGGTTPYTYAWSNGATTQNIENLTAGAYGVTVADAGQCYSVLSFNINQPAALQVSVYDLQHVPCPQDMTGSAAVSATGGIAPYAFFWSSGSPQNLSTGTYTVTVSDANACTKTATFSIVSTDSLAPQMTCPDDLEICAPGIVDYQKAFASDNCGLAASPSVLSGPPSGSFMEIGEYTIIFQASDASGNTATCSFSISVNEQVQIVVDSFANDQNSQSVGLIWVSPVGGGGYTYAWSKDGQPYSMTEDLSGLGAGIYTLTLLDSNGCTATLAPVVVSNVVGTDEPVSIGWIKLRPNPAQSYIQLEIKDLEVLSAMVLDIRGGLVNRIEPAALLGKIDIQHLPEATYFLKLITGNGGVVLLKFVKAGN